MLRHSGVYTNMVKAWGMLIDSLTMQKKQEETKDSLSSCGLITELPFCIISGDFSVQFEVEEYPSSNVCLVIFLGAASSQGLPSTLKLFFIFPT